MFALIAMPEALGIRDDPNRRFADGAIQSLSDITIRLKELAEQSANGIYGVTQRKALDQEAQALSKEYSRIVQSTKFNNFKFIFSLIWYC